VRFEDAGDDVAVAREHDQRYDDAWRYERFLATVAEQAGISREQAERAARATLQTLAERISTGAARDLARELPRELREPVQEVREHVDRVGVEGFHVEELVRRVAGREGVDAEAAAHHARAVLVALARFVPGDEVDDIVAELPQDYETFVGDVAARLRESGPTEALSAEEFVQRVARRAGLDPGAAQRATEAVLELLAQRIGGGEVEDLAAALSEGLRAPLQRGRARSGGNALRLSLDEFVGRVAEREGVGFEEAMRHARAVFETLREALPRKELSDILAQLPRGYREALL
jgi:uncharacterized protein (DUF2267 family)